MKIKAIIGQIISAIITTGLTLASAFIGLYLRRNDFYYGSLLYILTFVFLVISLVLIFNIVNKARKSSKQSYKGDLKAEFARWDKKQKVDS